MADALGLLGILLFIICVIGLAAGVTWIVVKLSPLKDAPPQPTAKD